MSNENLEAKWKVDGCDLSVLTQVDWMVHLDKCFVLQNQVQYHLVDYQDVNWLELVQQPGQVWARARLVGYDLDLPRKLKKDICPHGI